MASVEAIRRLTVEGQSRGLDRVAADLAKVSDAQAHVATTAGTMAVAQDKAEKSVISVGKAWQAQGARLDPAVKAMQAIQREQGLVDRAVKQGIATQAEAAARMALVTARYGEAAAGSGGLAKALHTTEVAMISHAAATGLNRSQMMELTHVARATFDSIVAGASPFHVLTQQAGNLTQALSSGSGGIGGSLKVIGAGLAGLATPAILLGGSLAAIGATGVYAFVKWEEQLDKLGASLDGIGRRTGLTADGLNRIATNSARVGGISTFEGQDLAAGFAGTGKINGSMIGPLIEQAKIFARVTGQDIPAAGQELAKAFADPAKGADRLNEKMGFLDDVTRQMIQTMAASGNSFGAQSLLLKALTNDIDTAADHTWTWTKIWNGLGNAASNALGSVGKTIQQQTDPTLGEQYAQTLERLKHPTPHLFFQDDPAIADQATADDLNEQLRRQQQLASQKARDSTANDNSIKAGAIARGLSPDIQAATDLQTRYDALKAALDGGQDFTKLGIAADQAAEALDRAKQAMDSNVDSATKLRQTEANAVAGIYARSAAEKAAVAVEAKRIELEGQAVSAAERTAQAQAAAAEVYAQTNRSAADTLRGVQDSTATAGMLSYSKALADISIKYRRMIEDANGAAGAIATLSAARNLEIAALYKEQVVRPIQDANRAVNEQIAALHIQQEMFGSTTGAIAAAAEAQRLKNAYDAAGVTITTQLTAAINAQAARAGAAAQAAAEIAYQQGRVIQTMDDVRGISGNFLSSLVDGAVSGKKGIDVLRDSLKGLLGDMTKVLERNFLESLLGKPGGVGGDHPGILEGFVQNLFGLGKSKVDLPGVTSSAVATANITAGVVNVTGGLGLTGASGGEGGGILSGLDALIKDPKKFWASQGGGIGPVGSVTRGSDLPAAGLDALIANPKQFWGLNLPAAQQAIKNIESSGGNYGAIGPGTFNAKLGRVDYPYGAYQVMGANVPSWTQKYLGNRMSPSEFLRNPGAQDQVFNGEFGRLASRYGPQGAAQAWLGGEGSVGRLGRADILGTKVGDYGGRFAKDYQQLSGADDALKKLGGTAEQVTQSTDGITGSISGLGQGVGGLADPLKQAAGGIDNLSSSLSGSGGGGSGGLLGWLGKLFGGGGGGGGDWNFDIGGQGLASGFGFHTGGFVGVNGTPRYVHPSHFDHAPRFHGGNLQHGEVPAILQTGELVLSRDHVAAMRATAPASRDQGSGGKGQSQTNVTVINQAVGDGYQAKSRSANGGKDTIIEIMKEAHASGKMDKTMGLRHGLSPAGVKR